MAVVWSGMGIVGDRYRRGLVDGAKGMDRVTRIHHEHVFTIQTPGPCFVLDNPAHFELSRRKSTRFTPFRRSSSYRLLSLIFRYLLL